MALPQERQRPRHSQGGHTLKFRDEVARTEHRKLAEEIYEIEMALRKALDHLPIRKDDHAGFIAGLQKLLDPVERVRNCVAHHRTIPKRTLDNYPQARDDLHRAIQDFWEKAKHEPAV